MDSMRGVREGGKEESRQSQDCDGEWVRRKVRNEGVGFKGGDTEGGGGRGGVGTGDVGGVGEGW